MKRKSSMSTTKCYTHKAKRALIKKFNKVAAELNSLSKHLRKH